MHSFPCSSAGRKPAFNAEDPDLIPMLGRFPGGGNDNPLQYSCLENPMDRRVWQVTVHGVTRVRHNLATKPLPPGPEHKMVKYLPATQETWVRSLSQEDAPEKGVATHSSILAWRIP